jgi:hypothetical protein
VQLVQAHPVVLPPAHDDAVQGRLTAVLRKLVG